MMPNLANLDKLDEEFSNFLYKVNQVNGIVTKLASTDRNLQEIGDLEAKQYLGEDAEKKCEQIDVDNISLTVKSNRTVLNRRAIDKDENPSQQSQESFMDEMSKDAERRFQDKKVRREKMETLKKQANNAFRRGELEKALNLYNKAIELIKDSAILYQNRALTLINLNFPEKAIADCDWALRLNENSLKSRLLLAKAYYLCGNKAEYENAIVEVKKRNAEKERDIQGFKVHGGNVALPFSFTLTTSGVRPLV